MGKIFKTPKHSLWWRKTRIWVKKRTPKSRNLRNGLTHRIFGEKLFSPELWKPTPRSLAAGAALGIFIGLTPTFPLHMVLTLLFGVLFKVHLPSALVACWITNPFTAPAILAIDYQLGNWINQLFSPDISTSMQNFNNTNESFSFAQLLKTNPKDHIASIWRGAKILIIGSLAFATTAAPIVYIGTYWISKKFFKSQN